MNTHLKLKLFSNFLNQTRKMHNNILKDIFARSVESVQPGTLIKNHVKVTDGHLVVNNAKHTISESCYVVGFGKAVFDMAMEIERALAHKLKRGVVTIPKGFVKGRGDGASVKNSKINFIEGAENNLPDENALEGARQIKELVEGLGEDDFLIVLISGGGSALLPLPLEPIKLEEKLNLIKDLSRSGADIVELNCVRKKLSALKGGGLAELAYPCRTVSLILSDIVGDPVDFIASGPTVPNSDPLTKPLSIVEKYNLLGKIPNSIKIVLENDEHNWSTGKAVQISDGKFDHVTNYVIGNNQIATEKSCERAKELGFQSLVVSVKIEGDTSVIADNYIKLVGNIVSLIEDSKNQVNLENLRKTLNNEIAASDDVIEQILRFDFGKKICLVFGGEPTVQVKGNGKGGRNQQLALDFALKLPHQKRSQISFLSCGTDGIDGPTDAAGAIVNSRTISDSVRQNLKPEDHLNDNNCYEFFSRLNGGENLVKIGHTGTNVMDVHLLIVEPMEQ